VPYPTRSFDQDCYQLIPSRFPPVDVYERLELPELRAAALEIEQRTNPRLAAMKHIETAPKPGDKATHQFQNWNHAPFVYKNPEGSHFLGPAYGVAEMAADLTAALLFALHRREEFFSRTKEEAMGQDMRVLCRRVTGKFTDLTGLDPGLPQPERWKIGQKLCDDGATGIVYRRPDYADHRFLCVFDGSVLGRALQGAHYRFVWDGKTVKSIYDFTKGETILRDDLLAASLGKNAA
jgi:RES domain-containing protein